MFSNLTGWHLLLVLAVVVLVFGATRLPALAKGIGSSMRIFRSEVRGGRDDADAAVDD
jgi:sec-independent protein translocase protein TatA